MLGGLVHKSSGLWVHAGNLETRMAGQSIERSKKIDRPIYICGLARSGTTILLEMLALHKETACHEYRDYPFIFTPLWWNGFLNRAGGADEKPVERYHKDGIMVTSRSPESMEEIIWMKFFPDCHDTKKSQVLCSKDENSEFELFYKDHIKKIVALRDGQRYLSKGNYNIARLEYLHKLFPDARFIIPVRKPAGQIASLMKQHRLFCKEEKRDRRIMEYMNRLGHYEFGLNRRAVHLGDDQAVRDIERLWAEGDELRGLAKQWAVIYGFAADLLAANPRLREASMVVYYENLCENPYDTLKNIYSHCELPINEDALKEQARRISYPKYYKAGFDDKELEIISTETSRAFKAIMNLANQ